MIMDVSDPRTAARIAAAAAVGAVAAAGILAVLWHTMGGPGDQLYYFRQAGHLLPFTDNYYGPVYFVVLRLIHDLLPSSWSWFAAGKLLSWLSLSVFLFLSWQFFRLVLGGTEAALAMIIVAVNPITIGGGFDVATDLFGACWVLGGILLATRATLDSWRSWLAVGVIFGLAFLTRFASLGFALGASAGVLLLPSGAFSQRLRAAALVVAGLVILPIAWHAFLLLEQGYAPPNYNFIHLTRALGRFQDFREVPDLIDEYGSVFGVLTSDWTAPLRIVAFGLKEAIKFPFQTGFQAYFIAAGFLVPGLLLAVADRRRYGPWLGAFLVGLFLMGIGSRDWVKYYVVIIPFGAALIVAALRLLGAQWTLPVRVGLVALFVVATSAWTAAESVNKLASVDWTELDTARRHLERVRDSSTVMASTAWTLAYGSTIPFVDLDSIFGPQDSTRLPEILREHGVTHLVLLERHSLWEHPWLAPLLDDPPGRDLSGLALDTMIRDPRKAAIYRVEPDTGTPDHDE